MSLRFKVSQIAELVNGEVVGDPNAEIDNFYKIEDGQAGGISFLANRKYEPFAYTTRSTALIISKSFVPKKKLLPNLIVVEDAYSAFATLMSVYQSMIKRRPKGIHPSAVVEESAQVGEDVYLGPFVYIGENAVVESEAILDAHTFIGNNGKVGAGSRLHSGVKIYADCIVGENCEIHAGTVVGSDGFGFAPQADGTFKNVPQLGNVIIKNNVSIGANTTIDRATMGSTEIGHGVKVDNLVQIGHNVRIGDNTVIASQTGVSGSTVIGKNCIVAGQVGFVGHVKVADNTKIAAKTGINKDIKKEGMEVSGVPFMNLKDDLRAKAIFRKLPDIEHRLRNIEKNHNI